METVLLKLSRLLMSVLGAAVRSARLECHQWKVRGRSPSEASQVTLVLLPRLRSDRNWKGTILGGRTPPPPHSWRTLASRYVVTIIIIISVIRVKI